jgi:hypothetical protein
MKDKMWVVEVNFKSNGSARKALMFFLAVDEAEAKTAVAELTPQAFSSAENIECGKPMVCQNSYTVGWADDRLAAVISPMTTTLRVKP